MNTFIIKIIHKKFTYKPIFYILSLMYAMPAVVIAGQIFFTRRLNIFTRSARGFAGQNNRLFCNPLVFYS